MSAQASRDTKPELALRRLLHRAGYRYRVAYPVPGLPRRTIDIAFTRRRLAVSTHGCFWHACPEHGTLPRNNGAWWREKLDRNKERDLETRRHLEALGWEVLEIWEHEESETAAERVIDALRRCDSSS